MTTNIVSKSKKGCSVDGCHGKHKAKELCGKHYQRERNHGSTDEIKRKRQLIYGHGINDADYSIMTEVNGKQVKDPFYRKWTAMLERCYCDKSLKKRPTYKECSVAEEWCSFMAFRAWMIRQDWQGKHLDKDVLLPGNKIYSPDACVFVTPEINALLTDHALARGKCPQGVCLHGRIKRYSASISLYAKRKHLGYYNTAKEAEIAYLNAKAKHIKEVALKLTDQRVKSALLKRASDMIELAKTKEMRLSL